MLEILWLIPLLPLFGFLINGLVGIGMVWLKGRKPARRFVYLVACGSVLLSLLLSIGCFAELLGVPGQHYSSGNLFTWVPGLALKTALGDVVNLQIGWGYQLDALSAVMILVVTGVGFLIHVYAIGYMYEDDGFYRFFAYMNLFMFMMLTLVLANIYLLMFVGWEGVGLCSYLLIGYYTDRKSAGDAAKKAFVVNRIGDFGFLIGMLTLLAWFGTLDFSQVFEKVVRFAPTPELASWGVLSWIAMLLFIGATGKSAQIPLYVWLPDAMEGPTPVSALIHAATMVTAGVYMVARSSAIYSRTPWVMLIVASIGILTALLAATIALFQRDIKKVLAYSTVSQLGYMFTALGVGAVAAGIFHLATHAFFKALLFLGSGSVIHAMHHEQDMEKMGGLRKYLPITCLTMWAGTLAIAGVPGLAGFFSKDEILWRAFSNPEGHAIIWLVGVLVAGLTAFYMFRLMFLTFYGKERVDPHVAKHLHESPRVMTIPLIVLAIGSVFAGYLGMPAWLGVTNVFERFLEPALEGAYHAPVPAAVHATHQTEILLTVVSVTIAVVGILIAYYFFLRRPEKSESLAQKLAGPHRILYNKYYVDEIYDAVFVNRIKDTGTFLWRFDERVVDGLVNGSAIATRIAAWLSGQADIHIVDRLVNLVAEFFRFSSAVVRKLQTGLVQRYALFFVIGIILVISFYLYLGV